jgi:uncharacterized protein (DUF305 family)
MVELRVGWLGVAPLAALALSACSGSDSDSGMPEMGHAGTSSSAPMMGGDHSAADVEFAQMMVAHHQQAVQLATLAETRAADAEVRALAGKVKAAQQPEITMMSGWLTGWGQPSAQASGHDMAGMGAMPGLLSEQEVAQLTAAQGVDFDRMFARMMIAHHDGAIQMANTVLAGTTNTQVKALAQGIASAQTAEVDQLQKILDRL